MPFMGLLTLPLTGQPGYERSIDLRVQFFHLPACWLRQHRVRILSQNNQFGPGPGKAEPVAVPCVRLRNVGCQGIEEGGYPLRPIRRVVRSDADGEPGC